MVPVMTVRMLLKSCAIAAGELADRVHLLRLAELALGFLGAL